MRALLDEALPEFAYELEILLARSERPDLASQVPSLTIQARCRCGDDFCSTFYTASPPQGAWGAGHWTLSLEPEQGEVILDLLEGRIVCVEVLFQPDVQRPLFTAVP